MISPNRGLSGQGPQAEFIAWVRQNNRPGGMQPFFRRMSGLSGLGGRPNAPSRAVADVKSIG